jgi:hypothetical protein
MTTAAVKAAQSTFKICFFMDHPVLGLRSQSFNMAKTDPTVTRFTDREPGSKSKIRRGRSSNCKNPTGKDVSVAGAIMGGIERA